MKKHCFHLLLFLLLSSSAFAQTKSEALQIGAILSNLQSGDTNTYLSLFPSYDTLQKHLLTSNDTVALSNLMPYPAKLQQFDPAFNEDIRKDFIATRKKGKDSGLHWSDIVMSRYELERTIKTRDLRGLDKVIGMRFQGYIMVEDMLTRKHYIIAVKEIQGIKGLWYGGHVINVLEAENLDEYFDKLALERKMEKQKLLAQLYPNEDVDTVVTAAVVKPKSNLEIDIDDDEDEDHDKSKPGAPKEVVERKLYTGTFDNQTKVELYIRGLKGSCPETVCYWEAIYRFQDQDEYIRLEVARKSDGTWSFDEEPDVGSMELKPKEDRLSGSWISNKDRTEYEVLLKEKKEIKPSKLEEMDRVIETGVFAN